MNPAESELGLFGDERTHLAGCSCDNKDDVRSANRDLLEGVEGPAGHVPLMGFKSAVEELLKDISYAAAIFADSFIAV